MIDYVSKQASSSEYIFTTTVARRLLKKHTSICLCVNLMTLVCMLPHFFALKPVTSDISENCVHSLYI